MALGGSLPLYARPPLTTDLTGFYVSGSVAYNNTGGTLFITREDLLDGMSMANVETGSQGISEGIRLGYNYDFPSKWFLGIELNADRYNNQTSKLLSDNAALRVSHLYGYGITLKGGYTFSPEIFSYLGVRSEYSFFKFKTTNNLLTFTGKRTPSLGWGPVVGIGYRLTDNMTCGAETGVIFFPSTELLEVRPAPRYSEKTTYTPRNTSFQLYLSWKF